jgi:glucose-6-phosphate 1-dehydrogenase
VEHTNEADALVIFGITGDLAKVMTFQALYRLEARSLLTCPIVGVAIDHWSVDDLRKRAQESIEATGEKLDHDVFDRLASRMSYLDGDFSDPATYDKVGAAIKGTGTPVFYLEIPPFLFGTVVKGLAKADLIRDGRVVVEKPFGHDLASARELAAEMHQYVPESQLYRIDHFLGTMGLEAVLVLRFANSVLEPVWSRNYLSCVQITMAESFGVEDRGSRTRSWPCGRPSRPPTPPSSSAASTTGTRASTACQRAPGPRRTPPCAWTSRTGAGTTFRSSSGPGSDCRSPRRSCA